MWWQQHVFFLSLSGSLPYVWRHITVKKNVLSAFLNKTFTSFLCFIFKTFLEGSFICIRITHTTVFAYTSHGALAGTRNSSMGPPWRIDPTTRRTMSERSYHRSTSRSTTKDRSDDPSHHERTLLPQIYILLHHKGSIRRPVAPWANALTTDLHLAPTYCSPRWWPKLISSSCFQSCIFFVSACSLVTCLPKVCIYNCLRLFNVRAV